MEKEGHLYPKGREAQGLELTPRDWGALAPQQTALSLRPESPEGKAQGREQKESTGLQKKKIKV